ncbi:hypothetical protein O6H91_19G041000 [Diphasiastrum complanatum]|uniref:Uncharacterized protein n=1 Tax=Diphasiastrum complanatum TaxID=34168 RepID=A0ACC2AVV0_DIPCM|nr:hypothetical protein O6H91_19G041000 [Diphasiastrum complanatum]
MAFVQIHCFSPEVAPGRIFTLIISPSVLPKKKSISAFRIRIGVAREWKGLKSYVGMISSLSIHSDINNLRQCKGLKVKRRVVIEANACTHGSGGTNLQISNPLVSVFTPAEISINKRKKTLRRFRVEAGRSKAKRKGYSGGRIESAGSKQKAIQKGTPKNEVKNGKNKNPTMQPGFENEKSSSTHSSSNPRIRHPDEYYKYGPFGPHAWKGVVVGKHLKGNMTDKVVTMYSTVKDEDEHEEMDRYNACVDYDTKVRKFDKTVGIKYYYVFVRQSWRIGLQVPWREWTLVSQVAVEYGGELDKWRLGFRLDKPCRDAITRCTAWFRPDLIYVKKPRYQLRFEPQEDFINGLIELLDPKTDWRTQWSDDCRFGVELDQKTYYGKLCSILGVPLDAHEDDLVVAYEKLDEDRKLACLEHILSSHPVELLHPFSLAWYSNRERRGSKLSAVEEDFSDEEEEVNESDDEEQGDKESEVEGRLGSDEEEDIEAMEKQFEDEIRIDEEYDRRSSGDHLLDQDWKKEWQEVITAEKGNTNWNGHLSGAEEEGLFVDDPSDSDLDESKAAQNNASVVQVDKPELLLKAAVRPFTYVNMIKEIWLIRQMLVNRYRSTQKLLL